MDESRSLSFLALVLVASAGCSASSGQTYDTDRDAGPDVVDDAVTEESGLEDARDTGNPDAELDASDDVEIDADLDAAVGGGELISRSYVGPEGTRDYLLYVPAGYDGTPRPLVMALHGCSQAASQFAYVTGYNHLADKEGFLVVWPEQNIIANATLCWNWFLPGHQGRDVGEAAILAGIVGDVAGSHAVDPKRVHAVGISAGAAMSVVLGAVFPERFASVGSVEGCPFNGTPCLGTPSLLPASTLAQYVVDAMGTNARPVPLFVIQGTLDMNILPQNAELLVQQWVRAADAVDDGVTNGSIPTQKDHVNSGVAVNGHAYETDVYLDADESVFVERWLISGLGHAWPGGATAIAYSDPKGPSATEESYRFFASHAMP